MVECPMPQDILKYKPKFIMNFSVREVCCAACGIGIGLYGYFAWFSSFSDNARMACTSLLILPFLLLGFVKLYDQPFEKIAPILVLENFIYPLKRTKEVSHPEFEKYEKTRYWMAEKEVEEDEESPSNKKKGKKKPAPKKVSVAKSSTYIGIK